MHFVYLGTVNLLVALAILGVALKAYLNFGGGLADHFNRKNRPQLKLSARYDLSLGRGSHCYPEESVISVTSYEYDEFDESVRLDRGMLHPALAALPLLPELSEQNLADKRSCSLPNLLEGSPTRAKTFPGSGEGNMSLLSGWLQAQEGKQNSTPRREINSISEEKIDENRERDTYDYGEKHESDEEIHLRDNESVESTSCSAKTNCMKISSNGKATSPNFHFSGHVNKKREHADVHFYRDVPLAPEHEQNGHLLGTTRLKGTEREVEISCGSQITKCSCEDDRPSTMDTNQGVCNGKKFCVNDQPCCQRTASLRRSPSGDDEVFDGIA